MTTEVFSPDEPRVNEPDANELNANAPEPPPIRVVVADDQPVVLAGFAAMIASAADLDVVATAPDGQALVRAVALHRPDVAVVDVRMPRMDGSEDGQPPQQKKPSVKGLLKGILGS